MAGAAEAAENREKARASSSSSVPPPQKSFSPKRSDTDRFALKTARSQVSKRNLSRAGPTRKPEALYRNNATKTRHGGFPDKESLPSESEAAEPQKRGRGRPKGSGRGRGRARSTTVKAKKKTAEQLKAEERAALRQKLPEAPYTLCRVACCGRKPNPPYDTCCQ